MKNEAGALSLLGFAQKGKLLAAGDANVEAYLKKGRVALLIVAEDLPEKGKNKWTYYAREWGIDVVTFSSKVEIGCAIGMSPRGVVGITDEKMAGAIKHKLLES